MRLVLGLLLGLLLAMMGPAWAERLVVVELFTSQGCSSCPPADALLAEVARTEAGVLPLDLHVTYWDRGGWTDPYSFVAVTRRQRDYQAALGVEAVYTPQVVVDGRAEMVGSDAGAVREAIRAARGRVQAEVALGVAAVPGGVAVQVGAGGGTGRVVLVGFDRAHETAVRGGENEGRTLREVNVVRSLTPLGDWGGAAWERVVARPAGERAAVLLEGEDGRILGAAVE